jgi:hypothetical protein
MPNQKRFQKNYDALAAGAVADPPAGQPAEPTDEELLVGFSSHYEKFPPDQLLKGALNEPALRAGDLVERDRAAHLRRRRAELARARAEQERIGRREEAKRETIERARRLEARAAMRDAAKAYREWIAKANELRDSIRERETTLSDLLANQPAEAEPERLRERTMQVAESRLLVDALKARLSAWLPREGECLAPLQRAVAAASAELITLHQHERKERIEEAQVKIDAVLDVERLRELHQRSGGGRLPELGEAAPPVIELDGAIGYERGSYSWNHGHAQSGVALLGRAAELERLYERLVPLVRGI